MIANSNSNFPSRYEALRRLGTGGGGEVWEVKDRYTQELHALKVLAEDAAEYEMAALVREAVALSGLEGLGFPRVLRFGRLPGSGRPYMVRELIHGISLDALMESSAPSKRILSALAKAAEQLTLVHRAGFFHGDVKPANIIVDDRGGVTLVDLGLAAPWRDTGVTAPGLTPKYAAPELLAGKPLTVRAEVYALGVALRETVERGEGSLGAPLVRELLIVAQRATAVEPELRHPSADEFSVALRRAAGLEQVATEIDAAMIWPILGIEGTANRLFQTVIDLSPAQVLAIAGSEGSGRTVLLRRLAWSLGVEGRPLVWLDGSVAAQAQAIAEEISSFEPDNLTILVDDAESLSSASWEVIQSARAKGATIVIVGQTSAVEVTNLFEVTPLGEHASFELLKRAIPSLTEATAKKIVAAAGGRPGKLRRFVGLLAHDAVVSDEDVEQLLFGCEQGRQSVPPPADALERALLLLRRGRYDEARKALDEVRAGDELIIAVAKARLWVGLGDARRALGELERVEAQAGERAEETEAIAWRVWLGRAYVSLGRYFDALEVLETAKGAGGVVEAEARAFEGLALSHIDEVERAREALSTSIRLAEEADDNRVRGLAFACLGLVLQRANQLDEAREVYEQSLRAAQEAGDASIMGTVQLNLALLLKVRGDMAGAIEHFEAALDMGRRSGRRATVRHALAQLADADLYLGRLARARASIEALEAEKDSLPAAARGQLYGLQGDLFEKLGDYPAAVSAYMRWAQECEKLGSGVDGAEGRLLAVLAAAQGPQPDLNELTRQVEQAKTQLGESDVHRPLVLLAEARIAIVAGDEATARDALGRGLEAARGAQKSELIWRILSVRADLEERSGQSLMARRDRIEAVTVLEETAARLPPDLREVFWNDARRRALRHCVDAALGMGEGQQGYAPVMSESGHLSRTLSSLTSTPLEHRLARLLEINRELLGELDLDKLSARVVGYAVELLRAERGFIILRASDGSLNVHSSSTSPGDREHLQFSRSIAERVIETREPIVSMNARDDLRMQSYRSVHQMLLESVACVPIIARRSEAIGALYVETRRRPGHNFSREVPTLRAFADQVALAIETARLVSENRERADALARKNEELRAAQSELKELLGERTQRLKRARQKLRETQDALYGRFGYHGLVGTSSEMRRCYSLIDRLKDTDVPVLITGESGTGKEVAARAIHRASNRSKAPFLGINCGAIPEHLLESELFGHVRGAFTSADRERKGLLREAQAGTVLLDEIGEMPHKMQAGLLRVLQERKLRPVGGTAEIEVQCRFIFATHRDLRALVANGKFREDLFYRIHVVEVPLPPLRQRLDDIPLLVDHFLGIFSTRYKRERKTLTREAKRRLAGYAWPGNVRQLEHTLLNAWILSESTEIEADDLELPVDNAAPVSANAAPSTDAGAPPGSGSATTAAGGTKAKSKQTLSAHRRTERERIIEALEACNWNRVKAAELSGIPRRTFYRRLREYKIQ